MNNTKLNNLITETLAIEAEEAKSAGALGYMAQLLVQASLPYKDPGNHISAWGRENGNFSLVIQPGFTVKKGVPICTGFPYGNIPRLLLAWITTEAIKKKERTLILGHSLSDFMRQLDLTATGGRWGSIIRIKEQTKRLLAARMACTYEDKTSFGIEPIQIADKAILFWDPKAPEQASLWESTIELNPKFFEAIINNPIPIDMRALKALKQSPLALDMYCWLTYRMSYLKKSTKIPWDTLAVQFGSNYADSPQGRQGFKRNFLKQLKAVQIVYSELNVEDTNSDLILKPSLPHIPLLEP
ncbi:MAG: replication protein RepA [Gammaproteobacteria bacterium]